MEESAECRISQLPDAILQHILSFIPIKQAVQTSIVSKRWQNLWPSMSHLHFNFAIHDNLDLNDDWQARQDFSHNFQHFVSNFLSHRDHASTIRKFHLSLDPHVEHAPSHFIESCVDYALTHGSQTLHLHAPCFPAFRLPPSSFDSKTLRELELRHLSYGVYLPENVMLPHLKILCLENSYLTNDGELYRDLKEPFSRFPELEKLSLHQCVIRGMVIIGPKLRVLEIFQKGLSPIKMERIWTPRLSLFRYEACLPFECWEVDFTMLEETYLNILADRHVEGKWKALRCVQMLHHLRNAAIVTLTLDTIKVLQMDRSLVEQSPTPFPNMKCLRLRRGRREIPTIQQRVMNYLRGGLYGDSLMVEFPEGVSVIEEDCFDEELALQLQRLFA